MNRTSRSIYRKLTIIVFITLAHPWHPPLIAQDVGVIRWDAWVGDLGTPGLETEESMGPPEFHWKTPFYSVLVDDYHILARATSQEVIDDEIRYAAEAGIDYFAFLYYTAPLSTALNLYFSSSRMEEIRFCMIGMRNGHLVLFLADGHQVSLYIKCRGLCTGGTYINTY